MRHWSLLHSGLFAGGILLLGALAVWRAGASGVPRLPVSAGLLNGELAKQFENHYDQVFPARTFGVNLWAALELALFREGRSGVRVGEQGWLFTSEEFKTYPDAEAQVALHLGLIPWVRDQLAQRQALLLVAVVPAKTRLYPEYLGEHRPAPLHAALHGRFHRSLKGARIASPDLLTALTVCKQYQPVFLRTDTHWTPSGAQCAARIIGSAALSAGFAPEEHAPYRTHIGAARPHRGDLFKFLPLDPYFESWLPEPDSIAVPRTEPVNGNGAAAGDLLAEQTAPRVALIGTSYSADERWNFIGALQESLGEDVVNFSDEGQGPFVPMLNYLRSAEIEAAPPGLVIWEIPERYLPMGEDLSAYALPAELRVNKGDES